MKPKHRIKAIKYIQDSIKGHEKAIETLTADLTALREDPPSVPVWNASVSSAWSSEGEPDWDGEIEAADVRDAVYAAMLAFCKKAGRVYPGYKSSAAGGKIYDSFDVQGTIYLSMALPSGTSVPVDRATIDRIMRQFNTKAPMPKKEPLQKVAGLT